MIDRVTITGADDRTSIQALVDLSQEFPFVEWGILASQKRIGTQRFPSADWCARFAREGQLQISMHLCGELSRRLFSGETAILDAPIPWYSVDRIQVNGKPSDGVLYCGGMIFGGSPITTVGKLRQIIFQSPRADCYASSAESAGLTVARLYDDSGGAGIVRSEWPLPHQGYTGYAGGIGVDNVALVLEDLSAKCGDKPFWIDMEGRVRDERNELDIDAVRIILEICAPAVNK